MKISPEQLNLLDVDTRRKTSSSLRFKIIHTCIVLFAIVLMTGVFVCLTNFPELSIAIFIVSLFIIGICAIWRSWVPFTLPYLHYTIDISGKRKPSYDACLDEWVIHHADYGVSTLFNNMVSNWDKTALSYLNRIWFWKKHKTNIYNNMRKQIFETDYKCFEFVFVRKHTRYRQINYQKYPYQVLDVEATLELTLSEVLKVDKELAAFNYETTREKYFMKNQRKLMTSKLRRTIMERDNYTCQICGKYMPDEVGLQIDHIVAIKNGGKSIPSNLQVTCDKCNLHKSFKR